MLVTLDPGPRSTAVLLYLLSCSVSELTLTKTNWVYSPQITWLSLSHSFIIPSIPWAVASTHTSTQSSWHRFSDFRLHEIHIYHVRRKHSRVRIFCHPKRRVPFALYSARPLSIFSFSTAGSFRAFRHLSLSTIRPPAISFQKACARLVHIIISLRLFLLRASSQLHLRIRLEHLSSIWRITHRLGISSPPFPPDFANSSISALLVAYNLVPLITNLFTWSAFGDDQVDNHVSITC